MKFLHFSIIALALAIGLNSSATAATKDVWFNIQAYNHEQGRLEYTDISNDLSGLTTGNIIFSPRKIGADTALNFCQGGNLLITSVTDSLKILQYSSQVKCDREYQLKLPPNCMVYVVKKITNQDGKKTQSLKEFQLDQHKNYSLILSPVAPKKK